MLKTKCLKKKKDAAVEFDIEKYNGEHLLYIRKSNK